MKKYIVIRDYQGGSFGMCRDYTAKEWGEQAYEWADSDGSEYADQWLLENFTKNYSTDKNGNKHYSTEQDLINTIADIWEIELVELDKNNEEVVNFLQECAKDSGENFYYQDIDWARKVLKELGVKLCKN
jgi:hypothetical protein